MLKEGDIAPDFSLETFDARRISLRESLAQGSNLILVFLRHLG